MKLNRNGDRWVQEWKREKFKSIGALMKWGGEHVTECYLHGFMDTGKKAYCAVVYHARLVASKTRVSPLKELSIPHLELMSARIFVRLMSMIRDALLSQLEVDDVKYWLDSKMALTWIQNKEE